MSKTVDPEKNISRIELIRQIRGTINEAAQLLKSFGPDHERVGWMLEDTLMYLDELEAGEPAQPIEATDTKAANQDSACKTATVNS